MNDDDSIGTNTKPRTSYGMLLYYNIKVIKVRKMKELEETNAHRASYYHLPLVYQSTL